MTTIKQLIEDIEKGHMRFPDPPRMPDYSYSFPQIEVPTLEERHDYASSQVLLERLRGRLRAWRENLPADAQPVIIAVLPNGTAVRVKELSEEGHNGVAITGLVGDTQCLLLAHQSSLQLLCYIEKVEEPKKRYRIGFRLAGKQFEE
jgi:hypothetical protein